MFGLRILQLGGMMPYLRHPSFEQITKIYNRQYILYSELAIILINQGEKEVVLNNIGEKT